MTAALANAKMDINQPKATANASARSSVEFTDSCNCCKFCLPCFGRKVKKIDATVERNNRTTEIMREAFAMPETPRNIAGTIKRSPGMESFPESHPRLSVDIHIDSGE